MYYVYMLCCDDSSLYTGVSNNVARRLAVHQAGRGAKYTRGRLPVKLVYVEACGDKGAALQREAVLKKFSREEKLKLVEKFKEIACQEPPFLVK